MSTNDNPGDYGPDSDLAWPFNGDDLRRMRGTLDNLRANSVHEPGKWMTSGINKHVQGLRFHERPRLRDITLRTIEQMGVVRPPAERREFMTHLVRAGVDEVIVTAFHRRPELDELRKDVEAARAINPDCTLILAGANTEDDIRTAAAAGYDAVQVWMGPFLGDGLPAVSGAVYHRAWQAREWRDLRIPRSEPEQSARALRLVEDGRRHGIDVGLSVALLSWADLDYIEAFCRQVSEAGAFDVMLGDHSSSLGPEGWKLVAEAATRGMTHGSVAIHSHDMFGLATANALAGLGAGAQVAEVAVNGLTDGPAQADLAHVVTSLRMIYEVETSVDLGEMTALARHAERLTGVLMPTNRGITGTEVFDLIGPGDEYVQEYKVDQLIHTALTPEVVGNQRRLQVNITTGHWSMADKLVELGMTPTREITEQVLVRCKEHMRRTGTSMTDDEVASVAEHVLATELVR